MKALSRARTVSHCTLWRHTLWRWVVFGVVMFLCLHSGCSVCLVRIAVRCCDRADARSVPEVRYSGVWGPPDSVCPSRADVVVTPGGGVGSRLLRGIRVAKILAKYLQNNRADGTILFVIFVSILLLLISSVAILQVEKDVDGANITSASDALWWSIVTMTTVGYGDKFPVTTVGRIIAAFLMVGGVGLFGMLSGSVTSWILNPVEERQEIDLEAIQRELVAIHSRLNEVSSIHSAALDPHLARLIAVWPELSEPIRREIQRLVITNSQWMEE